MTSARGLSVCFTALLLLGGARGGIAQRAQPATGQTVLFVCEHGTVKSLLAKVYFEQYAKEVGLAMRAESRGTHADSIVPPWMQRGLALDHVELGTWRPRTLAAGDLAAASYIVSFDVPAAATAGATVPRSQWDGLPSVSENYANGRDAIRARVRLLVDSLKRAQSASPDREQIEAAAFDVMKAARYASFVTIGVDGQPQARVVDPLVAADRTIWVATNPLSRKVAELRRNSRVTLLFFNAAANEYVTVQGRARMVSDAATRAARWKAEWGPFYKKRYEGPDFLLIAVRPFRLEISSPRHGLMNDSTTWRPVVLDIP